MSEKIVAQVISAGVEKVAVRVSHKFRNSVRRQIHSNLSTDEDVINYLESKGMDSAALELKQIQETERLQQRLQQDQKLQRGSLRASPKSTRISSLLRDSTRNFQSRLNDEISGSARGHFNGNDMEMKASKMNSDVENNNAGLTKQGITGNDIQLVQHQPEQDGFEDEEEKGGCHDTRAYQNKQMRDTGNDNKELDAEKEEDEESKTSGTMKIIKNIIFPILFLIAATIGSYHFTEATGIYALGNMSQEMQKSATEQIYERLLGYMDPLRIFLQTGIAMSDELGLDLGQFQDLQQLLPYQHHFLNNYLDDSRCCSGVFTNIKYDQNMDGVDDVLSCHALEAPDCSASSTGSMETEIAAANLTGRSIWAGVLHYSDSYTSKFRSENGDVGGNVHHGDFVQVLPGNIMGAPDNTLTFKFYEHKNAMTGDWYGDKYINRVGGADKNSATCDASKERCFVDAKDNHWVQPVGFVHWPIQDGYWYREIQKYDMQKGDIRSSPRAFPWTLYPPAVLKVHLFTPVFNKEGTERIGGWVVGFKLHWISKFLANLKMNDDCMGKGCFCFIVERETGHLIAASDPSIEVLTNEDTTNGEPILPIVATNSTDVRVSSISKQVIEENNGNWDDVHGYLSREEIKVDSMIDVAAQKLAVEKPFILTSDFKRRSDAPMNSRQKDVPYGIDWIIVLSVPEEMVMRTINERKTHNSLVLIGFSIGISLSQHLWDYMLGLLFGLYASYTVQRSLKNNRRDGKSTIN